MCLLWGTVYFKLYCGTWVLHAYASPDARKGVVWVTVKCSKGTSYMKTVLTAGPWLPGRPGAPCSPCKPRGPGEPRGPSMPGCPRLPSGPREPGSPGLPTWQWKRRMSVDCYTSVRLILTYQNGNRTYSQMQSNEHWVVQLLNSFSLSERLESVVVWFINLKRGLCSSLKGEKWKNRIFCQRRQISIYSDTHKTLFFFVKEPISYTWFLLLPSFMSHAAFLDIKCSLRYKNSSSLLAPNACHALS